MKQLLIYIILILSVHECVDAQDKHTISLSGNEIAELPSIQNNKSIGVAGPVVGVLNNFLIVAGGANFPVAMPWNGGVKKYYKQAFIFERLNKQIKSKALIAELPFTIAYAANCISPFGIVYAGGENENGLSSKVFLIKWSEALNNISISALPDLPKPITNASMTCINQTIYLVGGETSNSTSDGFYSLKLNHQNEGWKKLPSLPIPLSHSVSVVQLNQNRKQIFVIGGRAKQKNDVSIFSSLTYSYDIEKSDWAANKELPYPISAGTGIAYSNNCILLFGGDKGDRFKKVEKASLAISMENSETKKSELLAEKNNLLATHPGFSKELLLYNTQNTTWSSTGESKFATRVTTMAVQWGNEVIVPSGEIKAGIRTPTILALKISKND